MIAVLQLGKVLLDDHTDDRFRAQCRQVAVDHLVGECQLWEFVHEHQDGPVLRAGGAVCPLREGRAEALDQ